MSLTFQLLHINIAYDYLGDGVTDDTSAFQATIDTYAGTGKVIFIDAGTYILKNTITVPSGSRIVGECWPSLMASGRNFQDALKPRVLFRVGAVGSKPGNVQIQDLLFTNTGATEGLIAVEWNLPMDNPSTGSAAMWGKYRNPFHVTHLMPLKQIPMYALVEQLDQTYSSRTVQQVPLRAPRRRAKLVP